jgi:hypothetical protein
MTKHPLAKIALQMRHWSACGLLALPACNGSSDDGRQGPYRPESLPSDSAEIVASAIRRARKATHDTVSLKVVTYRPSKDGMLVRLSPKNPNNLGGGVLAEVRRTGEARILEMTQ